MPYDLHLQQFAVKDDNDNYTGFDVLSEKTTQQTIKDIEAAGDKVKESVTTEVRRYVTSMTSSSTTYYTVSSSGTTRPTSGWATAIPAVPAGQYLWTRINITFTLKENIDGTITNKTLGPYYLYSVARSGVDGKDGSGAVSSVNGKSGSVTLYAGDIALSSSDTTKISNKLSSLSSTVDGKQAKITTSGLLKGNGGSISAASKGTDYGSMTFNITLTSSGWSNKSQTVTNSNFLTSGYTYIVDPVKNSRQAYIDADIYAADSVSTASKLTFYCTGDAPSSNLTVKVVRVVSA